MFDRGKLVILIIFGLGLAATAFSWCYRVQSGNQALRFWGSDAAGLIRHAPRVELLLLDPAESSRTTGATTFLAIGRRRVPITSRPDISQAPGLLHARQALLEDASFAWDDSGNREPLDWRFAFRFSDRGKQCTIALDSACLYAQLCENGRPVSVRPISGGLLTFILEQADRYAVGVFLCPAAVVKSRGKAASDRAFLHHRGKFFQRS